MINDDDGDGNDVGGGDDDIKLMNYRDYDDRNDEHSKSSRTQTLPINVTLT